MFTSDSVHCMVWDITDIFPCIRAPINCLRVLNVKPIYAKSQPLYGPEVWDSSQANFNSIWSMLGHGPTNQARGHDHRTWAFSSSPQLLQLTGKMGERKKERKKPTNYEGNIPTTYPSTTQWWARDLIALILAVWTWASHLHVNMTHFPLFLSLLLNITWQQLNQAQAFSDNCFR